MLVCTHAYSCAWHIPSVARYGSYRLGMTRHCWEKCIFSFVGKNAYSHFSQQCLGIPPRYTEVLLGKMRIVVRGTYQGIVGKGSPNVTTSLCVMNIQCLLCVAHTEVFLGKITCGKTKLHVTQSYVTWLIRMCGMTHSYVWHDWFTCVTWLIHMWHDVISDENGLTDGIFSPGAIFFCDMTCWNVTWLIHIIWLIHMWHDSFTCDVTLYVTKGELQM